ncbi:MAG: hypothetical protein HUU35_10905 [Armatimonadetes bacterium]|nr:hypothetical protein [Armatimonadota bacterium]
MGQRIKQLFGFIGRGLRAIWRAIAWLFGSLGRGLSRSWRVAAIEREIRAEERGRRDVCEGLGRMVYVLYKRNLVRNADLLAECEKVVEIDRRIDELAARSDAVRSDRPRREEPAAPVAAVPLEIDPDSGKTVADETVPATLA